jgi:hypothetical protein
MKDTQNIHALSVPKTLNPWVYLAQGTQILRLEATGNGQEKLQTFYDKHHFKYMVSCFQGSECSDCCLLDCDITQF